ncbi:glycosyltransferase family 2 protein [Leisingera sp. McT4-56]|uniref:glycosyltransferase family 2 protein n=1 Tax=Leisingera sp. McT4-56 TaxID=2881255 RepID=UPI001CF8A903|nr:glycosyltransferase family 2 protein [Leisingera sp. McT4-56]MCB4457235.1 glycosyltransferase [Leisingera sp. McT4-56]
MKISVVTNAFNQGRFLRRCMESVLSQQGVELEYIVIDPGSTDSTAAILAEYEARGDRRLQIIREPDNGPADGLNKGFARASGDWFVYLNADDFFLAGGLAQAASAIAGNPGADCIFGDGYLTDISGVPYRRVLATPAFTAERYVHYRTLWLQQSTFYKAGSFRKAGGFNAANRTCWDGEILVDMALAGMRFAHVPGFWSAFVLYGESITGSQRHASEDRRNHERIYRKVMGRDRTEADLKAMRRRHLLDLLARPRRLCLRITDALLPGKLPAIAQHLPPVEDF